MAPKRGLTIHFNDGTSLTVEFSDQTLNEYARNIMRQEIVKQRILTIESDGALLYIPFENVKYITVFPAPPEAPKFTIQGASISS